ncbi:MAG: replicative DNA helicase [Acidobacteriota bacterium]|nr:replicative DNA helicase [Acidobacteriota bacterium]
MTPTREQFLERPLPSSPDSERVILGAILLDNELITQAIEQISPEDFYSPNNRRVFKAMLALFERGERIDPILIGEELKKDGSIDSIGGVATITNLTFGLPHFSDIFDYTKVVKDKAVSRNLIKVCNQITSEALAEEDEAEVILDHAEQMIFALADERTRQGFSHVQPIAETVLAKVQEYAKRESHALTGLSTGFRDLDEKTSGLQRTDLIIVAARPSMGKCLGANSEIVEVSGNVETIETLYQRRRTKILTLKDNYKFAITEPCNFIDDGIKPVFRVTTKLGRQIETTITHPYLTINGWRKLEELKVGNKIAVPRILNVFGKDEWRECEAKILGYLLGDGCLTRTQTTFIVGKKALQADFEEAISEFGGIKTVVQASANRTLYLGVRKMPKNKNYRNPLTIWLKNLGVNGCNSHTKFIPKEVFTLKKELIAILLNRLFSTDGWASVLTSGQVQLGFASVSEEMIRQVQHLLLRFGVIAKLKKRAVKYKEGSNSAWQIDITDALSIKTFIREIGIFGKEAVLKLALERLENRNYQTNGDLIPIEIWESISQSKGAESWASLARRAELKGNTNIHVGKRAPSRRRLENLATALENETLQNLAKSEVYWDEIVSIEYAGEKQVYDLTIPETHNFVANDICVHNTALCLTLAQNAAIIEKAVVAIFSLEMSKEQLVMRMLSSEARVDAHRFRTGYLTRDEWGRLAEAIGTLSNAKIFIDDTAGISILEMRAKTRRLAAEQKQLDLVVVDYLQLMSGGKRSESRQQEVSQISRELKGLAKELQVPIVALSQLSRAPEARNPPRPMMSDLRESGCIAGESLVTLADTGERIPIKDLVGKKGFRVWALNEETRQLEKAVVTNAFATGRKPVFLLTTRLGREIRATANHKFYTFDGWKRLDELEAGEKLALPREIQNLVKQTMSDDELALLAHLIGDGCTLPRHAIQYTTRKIDLAEMVANLAKRVFGDAVAPRINQERTWYQVYLASTRKHTHNIRSAVAEWLDDLGVWGLRSSEKFIPEKVFMQPREAVALFLRHLWATDGCIWVNEKSKHYPGIYYASSSERLAKGVQDLLLRIGIKARLRRISQGKKGKDQHHVIVSGKEDIETFINKIGAVWLYKKESLSKVGNFISQTKANSNRGSIPNDVWKKYVVPSMKESNITTRQMFAGITNQYCGTRIYKQNISRERAFRLATTIKSDELLKLAQSDIYWDEIMEIIPGGETEVYDLTVENLHSFICNNIVLHNSIEQDADVVTFIYREDYYKPSEENAGIAELLIAKQRNGPTGTVKLAFLKEFTRFENYFGE